MIELGKPINICMLLLIPCNSEKEQKRSYQIVEKFRINLGYDND